MMHWSWRQHTVVCAVLVGLLLPLGAADAMLAPAADASQPGMQGMLLIPAVLWVGGTCALSTTLVALLKPRPARAWQSYVLAGLLATVGLGALTTLAERLDTGGPTAQAQAIAETVTLRALAFDGTTASATIALGTPTTLRHLTLRSQKGFCEGTEWPADTAVSGEHTFRVSLRCAGGVTQAREWRLSTVAEQDGATATLVWSDAPQPTTGAVVRPLP